MTTTAPELDAIKNGYYAVPDPMDPATMTYWHRLRSTRTDGLRRWPANARYGPAVPRRSELPGDPQDRAEFVATWSRTALAYNLKVVAAIAADPIAAARAFADFGIRCCQCARPLKDASSKVYGIGPDCREGMDPELLAHYLTPQVGRAHAAHIATQTDQRAGVTPR